jgi:phage terminase small subunit
MADLSERQKRFVAEYLIDLNATKAYTRAGYTAKAADVAGPRLLGNVRVSKAVAAALERRAKKYEISADRVLEELAAIAFADIGEVVRVDDEGRVSIRPLDKLEPRTRRAIAEVSQVVSESIAADSGVVERVRQSVKHHSKVAALKMLMDHLGMEAPKKREHSGELNHVHRKAPEYGPGEVIVRLTELARSDPEVRALLAEAAKKGWGAK